MKKILFLFVAAIAMFTFAACSKGDDESVVVNPETPANPETPSDSSKILVAYFRFIRHFE